MRLDKQSRRSARSRRGNIIVFSAFLMVFMMFMIAMAVDVGYIYTMQTQLDRAVVRAKRDPFGAGAIYDNFDAAAHTFGLVITARLYRDARPPPDVRGRTVAVRARVRLRIVVRPRRGRPLPEFS